MKTIPCSVSRLKTKPCLKLSLCGSDEALMFAQSQLTDFGKEQKFVKKLEVCSSDEYIPFYI